MEVLATVFVLLNPVFGTPMEVVKIYKDAATCETGRLFAYGITGRKYVCKEFKVE